jgi:hypothetical protein
MAEQAHRPKRPLTVAQILAWADDWRAETGQWPRARSGAIRGAGLTWQAVNLALNSGRRGLPGGDTLAKLLGRERGRPDRPRGPLADPEKRALAQRLRVRGWTVRAIGNWLGVCGQAVSSMLRRRKR